MTALDVMRAVYRSKQRGGVKCVLYSRRCGATKGAEAGNDGGGIQVTNDFSGSITIGTFPSTAALVTGDIKFLSDILAGGSLTIHGSLQASLEIEQVLSGTIDIKGDLRDLNPNHVRIFQMTNGTFKCRNMDINGGRFNWVTLGYKPSTHPLPNIGLLQTGTIDIGKGATTGHLAGTLDVTGNWHEGDLIIHNNVTGTGKILVSDHFRGGTGVTPTLHVLGNMDGLIEVRKNIRSSTDAAHTQPVIGIDNDNDLNGLIRILGSLKDGVGDHEEISIAGTKGSTAAITVDYDGDDTAHSWRIGAEIVIGIDTFTGNDATEHLYDITSCRGDMTNDGILDAADRTEFDKGETTYQNDNPGLAGSSDYHGDANCSLPPFQIADGNKIDDYIAADCCTPDCFCFDLP